MNTLIVTDIFGKTEHIQHFADSLPGEILILDPYDGKNMGFINEAQAYEYFNKNIGLQEYTECLKYYLSIKQEPIYLIGFSVGATAIWNASCLVDHCSSVVGASCFYGSKIRLSSHVIPVFPITLIWPQSEEGFSISALIQELSGKQNVQQQRSDYLHGFMNKLSINYNEKAVALYCKSIQAILSNNQQ
jgi:dienelactone hydrolase